MFAPGLSVIRDGKTLSSYVLEPCLIQHWQGLSTEIFNKYKLGNLLCPPLSFITSNIGINGPLHDPSSTILALTLKTQPKPSQKCINYPSTKQYLLSNAKIGVQFQLYIYDTRIQYHYIDAIDQFINTDVKIVLRPSSTEQVVIEYSKFTVSTDDSFMPWTHTVTQNGNYIDRISKNQKSFDMALLSQPQSQQITNIFFVTNQKYTTYTRKTAKASQVLSSAGGLLAFLFAISALLFFTFNSYVFQMQLSKQVFKDDEPITTKMINQKNPFFFIKYNIFKTAQDLFNKQLQWQDCKLIDRRKKQSMALLDINRLFKRLQNVELAIKHCVDKNQAVCLGLVQKMTYREAKNYRLENQYYDFVMAEGRSCLSLQDLRVTYGLVANENDGKVGSLQQFYEAITENNKGKSKQKYTNSRFSEVIPDSEQQIIKKQLFNSANSANNQKLISQQHLMDPNPNTHSLTDENSPTILNKTFFQNLKYLKLILQQFPQLKQSAKQIQLPESYQLIQQKIAKCFINMREIVRLSLQEKIPIIILWRLIDCIEKNQYYVKNDKNNNMEQQQNDSDQNGNGNDNDNFNVNANRSDTKMYQINTNTNGQLEQQYQQQQNKKQLEILSDNIDIIDNNDSNNKNNINSNNNQQNRNSNNNNNNDNNNRYSNNIDDRFDQKYVQGNIYQQLIIKLKNKQEKQERIRNRSKNNKQI